MDKIYSLEMKKILNEIKNFISKGRNDKKIENKLIKVFSKIIRLQKNGYLEKAIEKDVEIIDTPNTLAFGSGKEFLNTSTIKISNKGTIFLENSKKIKYILNMYIEDYKRINILISILALVISIVAILK